MQWYRHLRIPRWCSLKVKWRRTKKNIKNLTGQNADIVLKSTFALMLQFSFLHIHTPVLASIFVVNFLDNLMIYKQHARTRPLVWSTDNKLLYQKRTFHFILSQQHYIPFFGTYPIAVKSATSSVPLRRLHIQSMTLMFSPYPGHSSLPWSSTRNQLTW